MTREEYERIRDDNDGPDNEVDAELEAEMLEWVSIMHREPMEADHDAG